MDKKLKLKNFDNKNLSQSYDDSMKRILGIKNNLPFEIPIEVVENRKQFWNDLFEKYTDEFSDDTTLNILSLEVNAPIKETPSFVQHWVNTGRIPYKIPMDLNKRSEHCIVDETSNEHFTKPDCRENGSSSSVDTAAYILSNMNTTNKTNTLAIVEGSKQNISSDVQSISLQNREILKHSNNDICKQNEDFVQCNNEINHSMTSSIYSCETQKYVINGKDITLNRDTTQPQQSSCIDLNESKSSTLSYSKLFSENLMHIISNNGISHTTSEQSEETFLIENNYTFPDNSSKLSQRKKLYCNRDSPVDLVRMNSLGKKRLSLKKCSHPALESGGKIRKRYKIYNKRRERLMNLFRHNNSKESLSNSSTLRESKRNSLVAANSTLIKRSNDDLNNFGGIIINNSNKLNNSVKSVVEFKKPFIPARKLSNSKLVIISKQTRKSTIPKCEKSSKKISPQNLNQVREKSNKEISSQNLNPVVRLEQLSEFITWKYNKSNKVHIQIKNLNPVISLKRLSEHSIQPQINLCEVSKNLKNSNPVIDLKQISMFNTKKHTEENRRAIIPSHLNPIVRLVRLSDTDIKVNVNPNELKNNIKTSQKTTQIQNNDISCTRFLQDNLVTRFRNSKTINLTEDTDSDQSTLLIYQCENNIPNSPSASNLTDINDVDSHKQLKIIENDASKKLALNSLNNSIDKLNKKCTQKTEAQKSKQIKSNRKNCKLRMNKINKTNNNNLHSKQNMDESIGSYKHINNALCSKKIKVVLNNICTDPDKNNAKKNKNRANDFVLSDEDDEFINLIPGNKNFDNGIDLDSSDITVDSNQINKRVLRPRSSLISQSIVNKIFRKPNLRMTMRNKTAIAIENQMKVHTSHASNKRTKKKLNDNCLHFQTKLLDSDSEISFC